LTLNASRLALVDVGPCGVFFVAIFFAVIIIKGTTRYLFPSPAHSVLNVIPGGVIVAAQPAVTGHGFQICPGPAAIAVILRQTEAITIGGLIVVELVIPIVKIGVVMLTEAGGIALVV